ncbi:MAG TPA: trypsin-like peptidase domain-containing protein [Phycisphaerales bacterium]|nr:trypsin-like peptidase domain-containing protein [Phycisphaerales bacterium]
MTKNTRIAGTVSAILLSLGLLVSSAAFGQTVQSIQSKVPIPSSPDIDVVEAMSRAIRAAADAVSPSVVQIFTTMKVPVNSEDGFPFRNRRFQAIRRAEGTGLVIRPDGFIVTNNHVVDSADSIVVRLYNASGMTPAKVVATDPESDLAVIRIDVKDLPAATLGDSTTARPGDFVVAIGSPFGLRQSVTSGIISATGRENIGLATFEHFIQHDCAVNPGNSGGPLVNLHGEVIGINTAISSESGAFQGVSFAIPSSMVAAIANDLIENGQVRRGWMGVSLQPLTPQAAKALNADGAQGVVVANVTSNSPAQVAGVQVNDVITKINAEPFENPTEMINEIAGMLPGTSVKLGILRNGKEMTIPVTLAQRSASELKRAQQEQQQQMPPDDEGDGEMPE